MGFDIGGILKNTKVPPTAVAEGIAAVAAAGVVAKMAATQKPEESAAGALPKKEVADAGMAIKIAEVAAVHEYGQELVNREKPFNARLEEVTWIVTGQKSNDLKTNTLDGIIEVKISQKDGEVLSVTKG